jgi:hypothetical protein
LPLLLPLPTTNRKIGRWSLRWTAVITLSLSILLRLADTAIDCQQQQQQQQQKSNPLVNGHNKVVRPCSCYSSGCAASSKF